MQLTINPIGKTEYNGNINSYIQFIINSIIEFSYSIFGHIFWEWYFIRAETSISVFFIELKNYLITFFQSSVSSIRSCLKCSFRILMNTIWSEQYQKFQNKSIKLIQMWSNFGKSFLINENNFNFISMKWWIFRFVVNPQIRIFFIGKILNKLVRISQLSYPAPLTKTIIVHQNHPSFSFFFWAHRIQKWKRFTPELSCADFSSYVTNITNIT